MRYVSIANASIVLFPLRSFMMLEKCMATCISAYYEMTDADYPIVNN